MEQQYVCMKCKAVVVVPNAMVLSPEQCAALHAHLCRDCFGHRVVKHL